MAMHPNNRLQKLAELLSADAAVLTDPNSEGFQKGLLRWSDIGRKTPKAIVLPASEGDCQAIVSAVSPQHFHEVDVACRSNGQCQAKFRLWSSLVA